MNRQRSGGQVDEFLNVMMVRRSGGQVDYFKCNDGPADKLMNRHFKCNDCPAGKLMNRQRSGGQVDDRFLNVMMV